MASSANANPTASMPATPSTTYPGSPVARHPPATAPARRYRAASLLAVLAVGLAVATLAGICLGAYRLTPTQAWSAWVASRPASANDPALQQARAVLLNIRLPRVLLALLVGAGFGAAGSAMQALFRNPLADPGLIGISSGAALGASSLIVLGPFLAPFLGSSFGVASLGLLPMAAFIGALSVAALVYRIASAPGRLALPLLLLAGIAINALTGAAIGLLTYIADDAQLRSLTFWSLGSLGGAQWRLIVAILPFVVLGVGLIARNGPALNAFQLGEAEAQHLGVPTQTVKREVLAASALCVGALVSCTGAIGFIGLVAPHCVRLVCGPDQRIVMPCAILLGATLTVLADLAARTVAIPAEVPLGVLTALLGGPFFLVLLWRSRNQLGL